jgi:hypothetical protein
LDYRGLTFHDAAARFSTGDDTPRAYLERCLTTIAEREDEVKAPHSHFSRLQQPYEFVRMLAGCS